MLPEYLTITEIADELRVSKMTIYRLCHDGLLPCVRVGRSFRVTRSDLNTYLKQKGTT